MATETDDHLSDHYAPLADFDWQTLRSFNGEALSVTFEMNGKGYHTRPSTLDTFRRLMPAARECNDFSAVGCLLDLGLLAGGIVEMDAKEARAYGLVAS